MRSRLIMNFIQASSSRAWAGSTSVMTVVTALSISMSSVSRSRSRWRKEFSRGAEPVAIPSAAAPAAFLGEMTGFNGAPDDMVMGRFGGKTFNTCGTHEFSLWRRRGSAQSD